MWQFLWFLVLSLTGCAIAAMSLAVAISCVVAFQAGACEPWMVMAGSAGAMGVWWGLCLSDRAMSKLFCCEGED